MGGTQGADRAWRSWITSRLSFQFPDGIHVNFEANQITPRGFSRVGEEFTGTKGVLLTSRAAMMHMSGPQPRTARRSNRRAISPMDGIEAFLTPHPERQGGERRRALRYQHAVRDSGAHGAFTRKEATWKGEFGTINVRRLAIY